MPENNKFVIRIPRTDLTKPTEAGIEVIKGAQELIRKFGSQVEPALYGLLCDTNSPNRQAIDKALKNGGTAASLALIPLLTKDYGISPAIATMVSAVVLQAIATVGQEKLCQAMAAAGADRPAPKPPAPPVVEPEPDPAPKPKPRLKSAKPAAEPEPKSKPKSAKPKATKPAKPKAAKPAKPRTGAKKKEK